MGLRSRGFVHRSTGFAWFVLEHLARFGLRYDAHHPPTSEEIVNKAQIVESLQTVPLFAGLSKKELGVVATVVREVNVGSGGVLAKEGGAGVGFFLILHGVARVVANGRTRRRLGPGDTFGEIALLDPGPRTADVIAEDDMQMLGVAAWEFRPLLTDYPSIAVKLLQELGSRLRASSKPDEA